MPRPEEKLVAFEIDGRDVRAPEGAMLVDGAKRGDVEIPVFCYEPKLGKPVGACRMCLVEIEGMPKLQTACSTPVKDGMVVTTTSDRVKAAQEAIVEFLLVNHPLDCPVCDKGGECPLQDISFGWGSGRSRFIEPKRHFRKPLELSPTIAIDRERCILCYRCVRFSQEVAEDHQLVFLERGDHTFVGTHDGTPYVSPFSGNIVDLCPVGALTSSAYRFRARPWDVEAAGSICTLCPSQCNVMFTVRDDSKVLRVNARDNVEVDDGWLCDKGRFGYQIAHATERITEPMVREGGALRPVPWERAIAEAAAGLKKAGSKAAALAGGETTNEEGYLLQLLMREMLGSPHIDARAGGRLDAEQARVLARPELSAAVSDIDYAGAVLVLDTELRDESPILELRVRKTARRNDVPVVIATSRPSALDPTAGHALRIAPGAGEAATAALAAALGSPLAEGLDLDDLAGRAGLEADALRAAAGALRGAGPVVVLWGERLSHGERGRHGVGALLALAGALDIAGTEGAGLLEVPAGTNARGLREVGCDPTLRPGLADASPAGKSGAEIAAAAGEDVTALLLMHADPVRTHPDGEGWRAALERLTFVAAFADFLNESIAEHADVVFPAEAYPEKEGTMTHPDGRLQRVRQGAAHPGEVRPEWSVLLALISDVIGSPLDLLRGTMIESQIAGAVPFYAGITLDEIGGKGVRWQEREPASKAPAAELPQERLEAPPELPQGMRLGTAPSLWASRVPEHAPVLGFLEQDQRVELSGEDGRRLGIAAGDLVEVSANGTRVRGRAALREALPVGSVFLLEGTREENGAALASGAPRSVEVRKA